MTHLRQLMLDELQRRNYSQSTASSYIFAVEDFAKYFHRSPERLGPEHIRQYQAYLFRERKLSPGTIEGRTAALRFLFIKTLRLPYLPDHIPFSFGIMVCMSMTRRSLVVGGATLAAASRVHGFAQAGGALTAGEVVERIKGRVGIPWMTETVDRIVAGSPEVRVKGIATTMMATLEVIQRAVAAGRNMIVTHEPTFWSHLDTTKELEGDPTYEFKRRFIAEHDVAVFRFHDHWHRMKPDGINAGMTRELGWKKNAVSEGSREFVFDVATLGGLVETMVKRLNAHSMRVVGDAKMPVKRVVANWGYASLMPNVIKTAARPDVDVVICGETREWELVEYVQDQIAAGAKKALIVVNHVVSEQSGMRYCADWLRSMVPEVPVEFVASKEPFWVARS